MQPKDKKPLKDMSVEELLAELAETQGKGDQLLMIGKPISEKEK